MYKFATILSACVLLVACSATPPLTPSPGHLRDTPPPAGKIPSPVTQTTVLPQPKPAPRVETYSVVVNAVPVKELLFALARDAKLNVDVHSGIEGQITLNAINQSLPQLLSRIARQVDMRYEIDGTNLRVLPDAPYIKQYKIDYLNMSRDSTSNVSIATQIATSGAGSGLTGGGGSGGASMSNNSTTSVTNRSNNRFWETLVQNIKDILRETDKTLPEGSSETTTEQNNVQSTTGTGAQPASVSRTSAQTTNLANSPNPALMATENATTTRRVTYREAASVIANPENGLIAVRATSRQHEKIQEFIDQVISNAKRQVLIEATVIEVQLSDAYQQGINWSALSRGGSGFTATQGLVNNVALPTAVNPNTSAGLLLLKYAAPNFRLGGISATLQLLESFGKVKVLSSPKISVLNNQTALLKVVDNRVYFTITAQTTPATTTSAAITTYTSELHTVPVGFVMSVTPQISDTDEITLNVRPTISRIIAYVQDPNPALANATVPVVSNVPVIQSREMESILKVASGQMAVMGGLMQDQIDHKKDSVPGLSSLPVVGDAFSYRNDTSTKTELVIFLRPIVVKEAAMNGDFKAYRDFLPGDDFFTDKPAAPGAETKKDGS